MLYFSQTKVRLYFSHNYVAVRIWFSNFFKPFFSYSNMLKIGLLENHRPIHRMMMMVPMEAPVLVDLVMEIRKKLQGKNRLEVSRRKRFQTIKDFMLESD